MSDQWDAYSAMAELSYKILQYYDKLEEQMLRFLDNTITYLSAAIIFSVLFFASTSVAKSATLEDCHDFVQSVIKNDFRYLFASYSQGQKRFAFAQKCVDAARKNPNDPKVLFGVGYYRLDRNKELGSWGDGLEALKKSAKNGFDPAAMLLFHHLRDPHSRSNHMKFEGNVKQYYMQTAKSKNIKLRELLTYYLVIKRPSGYESHVRNFVLKSRKNTTSFRNLIVGLAYLEAYGVKRNARRSVGFLRDSARAGNLDARFELAKLLPQFWFGSIGESRKKKLNFTFELQAMFASAVGGVELQRIDQLIGSFLEKPRGVRLNEWRKTKKRRFRLLGVISCSLEASAKQKLLNVKRLPACKA